MRWRALLVLAVVTVLWGAPPAASAAGNTLDAPAATPTTGTTLTPFTLRVSYSGSPAISVSVSVGGRTISMVLTAGSATQGTWSTTATLPEGNWPTTFRAETSKGRDPSMDGPTIDVDGPGVPTVPQATVVPVGAASQDETQLGGPAPSSTEGGPTAPARSPSMQGGSKTAPVAPVSSAGAAGGPGPSQRDGTDSSQAGPSSPRPAADDASTYGDLPGTPRAGSASRAPSGSMHQAAAPDSDHPEPGLPPIAAGIGGVMAAALLGWFVLLASRRLRDAKTGPGAVNPPTVGSESDKVDAALLRRTLRRAKIRLDEEDPILTSVGVGLPPIQDSTVHRTRRPRRQPPT